MLVLYNLTKLRAFSQLNTDIETLVRSMSTRRRIPSKSTEDVSHSNYCALKKKNGYKQLLLSFHVEFHISSQAAAPLMRYLEQELQYMNENLVQENFNRSSANSSLLNCKISLLSVLINFFENEIVFCH